MPTTALPMPALRPISLLAAAALSLMASAGAHEIPKDLVAHLLIKPQPTHLQVLIRVPLPALRDLDFPLTPLGYLDSERLAPRLPEFTTLWIGNFLEIYENGVRQKAHRVVATRVSLPSDRSFASFPQALAHVTGPALTNAANVPPEQLWLDALLEFPIQSDQSAFSLRPGLTHLAAHVVTALRFYLPDGTVRPFEFSGDPGIVPLDPRWSQAAYRFIKLGFWHILGGIDHLLFLACLVIPFRQWRPLVLVVTAFTAAHSVTLFAAAFDLAPDALWFPPLVETLIAVSIVYMALENIVAATAASTRWLIAFAFGLVHGFGFSFGLRETLQFAGSHLLTSLVCFNIGVELGQLAALTVMIPALNLLFHHSGKERILTIILSAILAHTGWHWMLDRAELLSRYPLEWPSTSALFWLRLTRGLSITLVVAALLWWIASRPRNSRRA